jgi:hypothetical protein
MTINAVCIEPGIYFVVFNQVSTVYHLVYRDQNNWYRSICDTLGAGRPIKTAREDECYFGGGFMPKIVDEIPFGRRMCLACKRKYEGSILK